MKTRKILFLIAMLTLALNSYAQTPKDTLITCYDNYLEYNNQAADYSTATNLRIALKSGYYRYGLVAFDMSQISYVRDSVKLGLYVYSSSADDFFSNSTQTTYPLGLYALKRNPTIPTNYATFFNSSTDSPAGDGFTIEGSLPKTLSTDDADYLGEVIVKKTDVGTFIKFDVTDFVNDNINGNDSVFFFLASTATTSDKASLYIKSKEAGGTVTPRLYLYDETPVALMQGGKTMYQGEKDSVYIYFPVTSQSPYSITYTDGTTPVSINNIQTKKYGFEVSPTSTTTYTLVSASDASGTLAVSGSAEYIVNTPNASISGKNTIYKGDSTQIEIKFGGVAPFSFSLTDANGGNITKNNITATTYTLTVKPSISYTYTLSSAGDANNSNISTSGSATITVADIPTPDLGTASSNWSLVYGDEFGEEELNTDDWEVRTGSPSLENDELRLYITKDGTSNVGAKVKFLEKLPTNTDVYLEARVKPLNAPGVTTTMNTETFNTSLSSKYTQRYAMSFPQIAYKSDNNYKLKYRLEDWKTNYYISEIDPSMSVNVVQDSLDNENISDYEVFGVEITKQDIIYYINGVEVKRASLMDGYNSGSEFTNAITSVGSSYEDIAQDAYGYYGQSDWKYLGGYTGDYMAYLMGLSIDNSSFEDSGIGKYAAVDYFRIYKLNSYLNTTPETDIEFNTATPLQETGTVAQDGKKISLNESSVQYALNNDIDTGKDSTYYFSTIVNKSEGSEFRLSLCDASGNVICGSVLDKNDQLKTGFGSNPLYYASTVSAEPIDKKTEYYEDNEMYLMVGRVETVANGDDYMSLSLFPIMDDIEQPYFYPNIDGDYGNTSLNNGWDINYKYEIGSDNISRLKLEGKNANVTLQKFILGTSFNSVLPKESFATFVQETHYIAKGETVDLTVDLKGTAPWTLVYSDGNQNYTINNITSTEITIPVSPENSTTYSLVSLTDGNGDEGIVSSKINVKVKSAQASVLYPTYDTYVRSDMPNIGYSTEYIGELKKDATWNRDAYFRYDISNYTKNDSIDVASLSMFFITNNTGESVVLSLYSVESGMPADIEDLCWTTRPDDAYMTYIDNVTIPNPGFYGVRAYWDVANLINEKLQAGKQTVDFCVKVTGGNTSSLLTWRQYSPDSIALAAQYPELEIDPYQSNTGIFNINSDNQNLEIYPNPVKSNYFYINNDIENGTNVNIYSISGSKIIQTTVNNKKIQIGKLPSGLYIVKINDKGYNYHAKLTIQ